MKEIKAIIFDLDGVIVDSEPRHQRAFTEIFSEMGYAENHGIHFHKYIGTSDKSVWVDFIARHQPKFTLDYLMDWKQKKYLEILHLDRPIYPEIPLLLEKLHARYPLAVASGSLHPVIDAVLALKNLRHYFKTIVSSQDVTHPKPEPDIFLKTSENLGVPPSECCVIEDSAAGVKAGIRAGMKVIAITNTHEAIKLGSATHVVTSVGQIEKLLLPL
ncbi:MAG: yqaB [Verrucomicrobiales bacterium]|nr:yqaB [Verrucomicrobiales bacterium]MDB6129442.1 yqaB [Verrucomicrobiales bacterium]